MLRVEHLSLPGKFENISLTLHAGEVVGIAGLMGAGRSEFACALFGLDHPASGDIYVTRRRVTIDTPRGAIEYFHRLRVRAASPDVVVGGLSGGNQQKVVLAKWLAMRAKVLILDEPTRGVDVGAKAEIHALIGELAEQGTAILLISSELPEVITLSERILVLREGRLVGEVPRAQATQDGLLRMMTGLGSAESHAAD